jgi:hypothetical protein
MRTLPEAVQGADPFRWVIASHVIEHVPDMIGWLDEVGQILADDGLLVLAIPDRRFSFDAARPPTTVGEMLLANRNRDMVPSVRAIYDHYTSVVSINAVDAWQGHEPGLNDRIHGLDYVRSQLRQAVEDGVYVDCHVWLFTPQSFVDQLAELAQLDRLDFVVDRVVPTATNELEFYAVLRRLGREVTADQRSAALATGFTETGLDGPIALRSATSTGSLGHGPLPRTEILSPREWQLVHTKRELMSRWRRVVGGMRTWPKSLVRRSADRR